MILFESKYKSDCEKLKNALFCGYISILLRITKSVSHQYGYLYKSLINAQKSLIASDRGENSEQLKSQKVRKSYFR